MANPRRSSYSINVGASDDNHSGGGSQPSPFSSSSSSSAAAIFLYLKHLLRKPHAFPILLSVFLLLTWLSLVLQQRSYSHSSDASTSSSRLGGAAVQWRKQDDEKANLVRFKSMSSPIAKDNRGWLLDPVALALEHGVKGGAVSCATVHLGEIRPGTRRGNHRHNACNETFVIWGAKTLFRLENHQIVDKGYAQVVVEADEVAVAASPSGTAHALVNMDSMRSTFFVGCQDCTTNPGNFSDYGVWHDL
ncbi:unnamed protein product [Linum trigynum]|uniref:Uncharacterized protein n=1 Tax=Linum trigynum TaxID=586398 RepID=A0AAV2C831_9ROSI